MLNFEEGGIDFFLILLPHGTMPKLLRCSFPSIKAAGFATLSN